MVREKVRLDSVDKSHRGSLASARKLCSSFIALTRNRVSVICRVSVSYVACHVEVFLCVPWLLVTAPVCRVHHARTG